MMAPCKVPSFLRVCLVIAVGSCCWSLLAVDGQYSDACSSDLSALPAPFNASGLDCTQVWNDFFLRYSQDRDNVLSIILSSTYTSGWIGMGFSKDGMMVGSSAMVGWIGKDKKPHIRQYYLGGKTSSMVKVKKGELKTVESSPPSIALFGPNLYMAFQLKFPAPLTNQSLLFAFGITAPTKSVLTRHEDVTSMKFDFSAGSNAPISTTFTYPYKLKRSHGALAIVGWGVLLPIGAIVARYCRHWNPLWYYLHFGIQFVGFTIGLAAVVAGIALYDKLHADVHVHRGIGIFVFVLGILQVLAFFVKPDKDSKYRRYWNWGHHWFGRLTLLFAVVNIVLGIRAGGAGEAWKIGYGVNIAFILGATVVLETMLWLKWFSKSSDAPKF